MKPFKIRQLKIIDTRQFKPGSITLFDSQQQYTLDPLGNRLGVDDGSDSESYLPNNGQKLLNAMHRYEEINGVLFDYDMKGNLLTDGRNTYAYPSTPLRAGSQSSDLDDWA